MKNITIYLFFVFCLLLVGCSTYQGATSTIISHSYDKDKDLTHYSIVPYGLVEIPGEWGKGSYNSVSGEQFLMNRDSIGITIAFSPINKYEFNKDGSKEGFSFAESFYEWELNYFTEQFGLIGNIIEKNASEKYIIWNLRGKLNNVYVDYYYLIGEINGVANNYSVRTTDKWNQEQIVSFLKNLYLNKSGN